MYWIGKTKVIAMSFRTYLRQVHMTFIRNTECFGSVTEMKTKIEKKIFKSKSRNLLRFSVYYTHFNGIYTIFVSSRTTNGKLVPEKHLQWWYIVQWKTVPWLSWRHLPAIIGHFIHIQCIRAKIPENWLNLHLCVLNW